MNVDNNMRTVFSRMIIDYRMIGKIVYRPDFSGRYVKERIMAKERYFVICLDRNMNTKSIAKIVIKITIIF